MNGFSGYVDSYPEDLFLYNTNIAPGFVNPSTVVGVDPNPQNLDWSLQISSPCIDSGTPDGWQIPQTEEIMNNLLGYNPINDIYDIGAFEFNPAFCTDYYNLVPENKSVKLSNYPNPFNPSTTISFELAQEGEVTLSIYNARGQLVNTLISSEKKDAGSHYVVWDGKTASGESVSSGMYFYKLETSDTIATRRMLLIK